MLDKSSVGLTECWINQMELCTVCDGDSYRKRGKQGSWINQCMGLDMQSWVGLGTVCKFLNPTAILRAVGICPLYPVQPTFV